MIKITPRIILSKLLVVVYLLICGEVAVRIISSLYPIYNVEMIKYTKQLLTKSDVPGALDEHRPNASANLMGVDISLNSRGYRSTELHNPKPPNEKRLHFLGTSLTLGWGVPADGIYTSVVEKRFNKELGSKTGNRYVAINAGVANYNTALVIKRFKKNVEYTNPSIVVLQHYIKDAEADPVGGDSAILKHSMLAAILYPTLKSVLSISKVSLADYYVGLYDEGQPSWMRAQTAIRELKAICDKLGIPLVAVLIPEVHDLSINGPYPPVYKKIQNTFEKMGIDMINTFPPIHAAFGSQPSKAWVARDDPHPSSLAHKIIGNEIFKYLKGVKF